jgi:hypothetical protein
LKSKQELEEITNLKSNILKIEMLENDDLLLIYKNGLIETLNQNIYQNLSKEFETNSIINFSDDKKLIAISNENNDIEILDYSKNQILTLNNTDFLNALLFSKNNQIYALANNGKIKIFNIQTQKLEKTIETGIDNFYDALLINENEILFVDKSSNISKVYNLQTNQVAENQLFENVLMLSKSENFTIFTTFDGQIKIIENNNQKLFATIFALKNLNWLITNTENKFNCNQLFEKSLLQLNSNIDKSTLLKHKMSILNFSK